YVMSEDAAVTALYYEMNGDTLTVGGNMPDYTPGTAPWHAGSFNNLVVKNDVKRIGNYAFAGCSGIETVTVEGNPVIGKNAFQQCTSLQSVIFAGSPGSIEANAFDGCSSLKSVDFPSSVSTIGSNAFSGCVSLESVSIPAAVSKLTLNTFNGLRFFGEDGLSIGGNSLIGKTFLGAGDGRLYEVSDGCIEEISGFAYIVSISEHNLSVCGLTGSSTGISIPSSIGSFPVVSVSENAFRDETSLTSAVISEGIRTIGSGAFSGCRSLEYLVIPSSVTSVGEGAFDGLVLINPNGVLVEYDDLPGYSYAGTGGVLYRDIVILLGDEIVCNGLVYRIVSLDPLCSSIVGYTGKPAAITVPSSVSFHGYSTFVISVSDRAFYGCKTLKDADLGSIAEIGSGAFRGCTALVSVNAGTSLKTINSSAFYGCSKLKSILLDDSLETLESIRSKAFYNCKALASVSLPSGLETLSTDAFPYGFCDYDYTVLDISAEILRGYVYVKENDSFVRQPGADVGFVFDDGILEYTITSSLPAKVTVSGYTGTVISVNIPESVEFSGFVMSVIEISPEAFFRCSTLKYVTIPDSVESIGDGAFSGCTSLNYFDGNYAGICDGTLLASGSKLVSFAAGPGVSNVFIPSFITAIGGYAFDL
ncbi:MAG: leucine-rich repeat domain-containing protein, partial [Candidatus Methanomethylophilaceae archaeon]|nr:leucine-rich repeat domain-containing protein [Candidatus Methanomethylophilaceae archaeon]